jgi:hypothetical protein
LESIVYRVTEGVPFVMEGLPSEIKTANGALALESIAASQRPLHVPSHCASPSKIKQIESTPVLDLTNFRHISVLAEDCS